MTTDLDHRPIVPPPSLLRLSRAAGHGRPAGPVRILHLGLGSFFRAHQAWYTDSAPDAADWGIGAFTSTSPHPAHALALQDGLYTLVTRAAHGERLRVVSSISAVHAGDEHEAWLGYWADRAVAVATFTVPEAGYARTADGALDTARADVRADLAALRRDPRAPVDTVPARVVAGLRLRRSAGAGPITLLPCDDRPANGPALSRVLLETADLVDPGLAGWIATNVSVGSTVVDRIAADADRAAVLAATGLADAAPVRTEPFSEWVIAGEFPAGRPAWDEAGAQVVPDVLPFEQRRLWLLHGTYSLLAYAGGLLGHGTIAAAMSDARVRAWVQAWWDEVAVHLPLPADSLAAYRRALAERFADPDLRRPLAELAADGGRSLPEQVLPVLRAELAAGRVPRGACTTVAAWVLHRRGRGTPAAGSRAERAAGGPAERVTAPAGGSLAEAVHGVLARLGPDLDREPLATAVLDRARLLLDLSV
ncbi:MAG TPA: mannitol dehydrogenase family protein [Cellulomonas sp.]